MDNEEKTEGRTTEHGVDLDLFHKLAREEKLNFMASSMALGILEDLKEGTNKDLNKYINEAEEQADVVQREKGSVPKASDFVRKHADKFGIFLQKDRE